jgi:Zn-dependent protease with chaperone function
VPRALAFLRTAVLLLAIPLLAFGAAAGVRRLAEPAACAAAPEAAPAPGPVPRLPGRLGAMASPPAGPCGVVGIVPPAQALAAATAAAALALLTLIAVAGALAGRAPATLGYLFSPILVGTNVAVVVLTAVQGILLVAAAAFFGAAVALPYSSLMLFGLAGVTVFGVGSMLQVTLRLVRRADVVEPTVVVERREYPGIWRFVEEQAAGADAPLPDLVVAGMRPAVYVTGAAIRAAAGAPRRLRGTTLHLSLSLARILRPDELRALVRHELTHLRGEDGHLTRAHYPLYTGTRVPLEVVGERMGSTENLPALPAFAVFVFLYEAFEGAADAVGRRREAAADGAAAGACPPVLAGALVKAHAFPRYWRRTLALRRDALARAGTAPSLSVLFGRAAEENRGSSWLRRDLDESELPHPTDVHPPLRERLAALGLTLAAVADAAFDVTPAEPATTLLPGHEALEAALDRLEQSLPDPLRPL